MHYDLRTIALHWLTAGLVIALWTIGQTADFIPRGPWRGAYWSLHFVLGFLFVAVLLVRIVWRGSGGRRLPPAESGLLQLIAVATYYLLYALMIAVAGLGVANAFAHGVSIFASCTCRGSPAVSLDTRSAIGMNWPLTVCSLWRPCMPLPGSRIIISGTTACCRECCRTMLCAKSK